MFDRCSRLENTVRHGMVGVGKMGCAHALSIFAGKVPRLRLVAMPDCVKATSQMARFHDVEGEEAVTTILAHDSGVVGPFVTTTGEAAGANRLAVTTDRRSIDTEPDGFRFFRATEPVRELSRANKHNFTLSPVWEIKMPPKGRSEQRVGFLKNLSAADLIAPSKEGIHSVELANATLLSGLYESKIRIPIDETVFESELQSLVSRSGFVKTCDQSTLAVEDFANSFSINLVNL